MAAILVFRLFPVSGNFIEKVAFTYEDHAETHSHGICPGKEVLNRVRAGGGYDIVIFRGLSPEEIPNAATDEKRLMAGTAQGADNTESSLPHLR
jgi:hypothetical protein